MVGLQGSGKTTTTAKIARRLTDRDKRKVLMASLDTRRPAAQEQLAPDDLVRVRALSRTARWQQERLVALTDEVRADLEAQQQRSCSDQYQQEATR